MLKRDKCHLHLKRLPALASVASQYRSNIGNANMANWFGFRTIESWNSLPDHYRTISDFNSFRRQISTGNNNLLKRAATANLQSWTKVLGQIYICGAFSHAPNKQSRANSSTLVQPLPPPPPPTMLDTCTRYFSRVSTLYWGGGGGGSNAF